MPLRSDAVWNTTRGPLTAFLIAAFGATASAQVAPPQPPGLPALRPPTPPPTTPPPVERLGPNSVRVRTITVDTAKKEVTVAGVINEVTTLEFLANTKGGYKAYESAIELETHAIDLNVALLLIDLDPARAVPSKAHLDATPPKGDPVEIWVEWEDGAQKRRVRGEQLVYNDVTKQTLSEGPWVYTGSMFSKEGNAYLADLDGALIGFVHSPSPVIESPRPLAPGEYGATRLNPTLTLKPGTRVTVTIRALPRNSAP